MKAVSLWQPWASLIASGHKLIETRGWETKYRGELAIHATSNYPPIARYFAEEEPAFSLLREAGLDPLTLTGPQRLPRGAVVATCKLVACVQYTLDVHCSVVDAIDDADARERLEGGRRGRVLVSVGEVQLWMNLGELMLGDYTFGRYLWVLDDVQPLERPITARGRQGLWEWNPPIPLGRPGGEG